MYYRGKSSRSYLSIAATIKNEAYDRQPMVTSCSTCNSQVCGPRKVVYKLMQKKGISVLGWCWKTACLSWKQPSLIKISNNTARKKDKKTCPYYWGVSDWNYIYNYILLALTCLSLKVISAICLSSMDTPTPSSDCNTGRL